MTEASRSPDGAGALLRAAREKQGLHIAALAAAIKVPPKKLEALENNRWDELHDTTFARALAQTVCRTLKIDPQPVLALLPSTDAGKLERVAGTLNTPFRGTPAQDAGLMTSALKPMIWGGALLLLASLVIYFIPQDTWTRFVGGPAEVAAPVSAFPEDGLLAPAGIDAGSPAEANAAGGADSTGDTSGALAADRAAAPAQAASMAPVMALADSATAPISAQTASPAQPTAADSVELVIVQASWITARDAAGQTLVSRLALPGERISVEGALPISLVIGNAAGVQMRFRQQPIDLPSLTRDNVARLQVP